jgi:hypothetical protein
MAAKEPTNFNEALDVLFRHVEKDSANKELYANLKQRFQEYFTSIVGKVLYILFRKRNNRFCEYSVYQK